MYTLEALLFGSKRSLKFIRSVNSTQLLVTITQLESEPNLVSRYRKTYMKAALISQ